MNFLNTVANVSEKLLNGFTNVMGNLVSKLGANVLGTVKSVAKKMGLASVAYKVTMLELTMNNVDVVNSNEAFMEEAKEALSNMKTLKPELKDYVKEELLEMVAKEEALLKARKELIKSL